MVICVLSAQADAIIIAAKSKAAIKTLVHLLVIISLLGYNGEPFGIDPIFFSAKRQPVSSPGGYRS